MERRASSPVQPRRLLEACSHHIGRGWQHEFRAALLVGLQGGTGIERGERNVSRPCAVLPVAAADVDHSVRDGIVGNLLAMAVAINQNCRRNLSRRQSGWLLRDRRQFWDGWLRIIRMRPTPTFLFCFHATESHIAISPPLDQQGRRPSPLRGRERHANRPARSAILSRGTYQSGIP
jgi:hypothetical protein